MTVQATSTNAPSASSERSPSSGAVASERRPLSQYILTERTTDEEREDGDDDFGWTIFDSDSEIERENEGGDKSSPNSARDLSVLKRIKRFLNDGANGGDGENDVVCGNCTNGGSGRESESSETTAVRGVGASFFDAEEVVASTRARVAYPFYDGTQNSAKNGDLRREPSFAVECVADSELVFEPRVVAWREPKRRGRKEKNVAANVENDKKTGNEAIDGNVEDAENAATALSREVLSNEETTRKRENASVDEVAKSTEDAAIEEGANSAEDASSDKTAKFAEDATIDEVAELTEDAAVGEVAEVAAIENVAPRTFVVDFSETVASARERRTAELNVESEKKSTVALSKRRKKVKIEEMGKNERDVLGDANVETASETLALPSSTPEKASDASWVKSNDRAEKENNAKKNDAERRTGVEPSRTADERTTIFQRFVQIVASSEQRSRNRGAEPEFDAENRADGRRQNANATEFEAKRLDAPSDFASQNGDGDAFGEVVSLVVAPTFSEGDALCPSWATASFSTFDAVLTGGESNGDGGL